MAGSLTNFTACTYVVEDNICFIFGIRVHYNVNYVVLWFRVLLVVLGQGVVLSGKVVQT